MIYSMDQVVKYLRAEHDSLEDNIKTLDAQKHKYEIARDKLVELLTWTQHGTYTLGKNSISRAHKLIEAINNSMVIECLETDDNPHKINLDNEHKDLYLPRIKASNSFVIKHDWASAFKQPLENEVFNYEFKLPYEHCLFELQLDKKYVLVLASQHSGNNVNIIIFISMNEHWVAVSISDNELYRDTCDINVFRYALDQVRAVCIALDTEIAETTVERAPYKLNKDRISKGRPPMFSYHIVDLSSRYRNKPVHSGTHNSPRFHLRRGHWRHYEDHKTWIKWTLVGNPDLGFIDKQYII